MYDAVVIGGGMIGSAAALGLAKLGHSVAIVENHLPLAFEPAQPPDVRLSALSLHTVEFLQTLGAWPHIQAMRCQPYDELAVWEQAASETDKTVFKASSIDIEVLGYFVENRLTQIALHKELRKFSNVDWFSESHVSSIDCLHNRVDFEDGKSIQGQWLVGADGAQSKVRMSANIGQTGWQYQQQALGIIVELDRPSGRQTWQQFRPTGPVALLPMYGNFAALIWYHDSAEIQRLSVLSNVQLAEEIHADFVPLDCQFNVVSRAAFPLVRAHANQYVRDNVVLLGDAAHTINPLAGQGVNIGFKDVEAFLAVFKSNGAPDTQAMRVGYEQQRRHQNLLMMSAMDVFYVTFSNDIGPLKWLRNVALKVAENARPIKQQALKYALGIPSKL